MTVQSPYSSTPTANISALAVVQQRTVQQFHTQRLDPKVIGDCTLSSVAVLVNSLRTGNNGRGSTEPHEVCFGVAAAPRYQSLVKGPKEQPHHVTNGERRRMDLVQKVFLMVKGGLEYEFPAATADAAKILDLGSGTSIWACQMAERYPNAHVMAVDLHNSSPRMHLKPGSGFIEQTEIDWRPGFEHERPQPTSALEEWCEGVLSGLERANRSAHIRPEYTRRMLAEAGFEHIEQVVVRLYLSPSPAAAADDQRELSKWFNLVVTQGFEAMALVPMIRYGSAVDPEQIEDLAQRAMTEACTLKYGAYMNATATYGEHADP
ncbi:Secondary metabolism regulator laeA [Emericellopsis cladophorae]|uniref:Secondary metabolism regulator laeA n=1 Tax=Emericellopsis cladophorae TaxID=2686198 RepID=A0A9Q0BEU5_9HYPO|nr:Secondary metabolism regulator laeA [Emericellopsis cladophorae]KAI6783287.1 Secondary metabolism regulator laeA [Emericellopsis cladophorae]